MFPSKLLMALAGNLVMVAGVFANAGPAPLPKDHKVAEPHFRFEGIDKHSDYVFYLYCQGYYTASQLVEVKDANVIKLQFKGNADRSPDVNYIALLAMDRKEFDKRKKDDPALKWLGYPAGQGVLVAKLTPPETTVPKTVKEIPVTTYRVTIKDNKLSAEKAEDKKRCGEGPTGMSMPPWTFGIVGSVSVAWLGIWFARRRPILTGTASMP